MTRLEERKLIERARTGQERKITITLLRPDGTGQPYTRPTGVDSDDRFLRLDHAYWTAGHHATLELPALAMLLVALHEKPDFELPTERMPDWYGWSADTAERGLKSLKKLGLLQVTKRQRKDPLAPDGLTTTNVYRLLSPYEHVEVVMVEQSGDTPAPVTDSTESPVVSPQEPYRPIGLADEFKGSEGRDLETRVYVEGRVPWPPASDG